jgi:hypothetical protein
MLITSMPAIENAGGFISKKWIKDSPYTNETPAHGKHTDNQILAFCSNNALLSVRPEKSPRLRNIHNHQSSVSAVLCKISLCHPRGNWSPTSSAFFPLQPQWTASTQLLTADLSAVHPQNSISDRIVTFLLQVQWWIRLLSLVSPKMQGKQWIVSPSLRRWWTGNVNKSFSWQYIEHT